MPVFQKGLRNVLENRQAARAEFLRMMKWILVAAVAMVAAALLYLNASGDLTANLVIATILGVFFSVLLGCGLFAAAFFSDKSGHDQDVTDATRSDRAD
jgi:lipopolysaccharide export LptBFGC system permease protein LptF